jgi:hypothetical protein
MIIIHKKFSSIVEGHSLLSSAQILSLNSTPIELLPAPGVGKSYDLSMLARLNFLTAAYATNLQLQIYFSGAGLVIGSNSAILNATATKTGRILQSAMSSTGATQYLENTAVLCNVGSGNPTSGGGSLDIYLKGFIVNL